MKRFLIIILLFMPSLYIAAQCFIAIRDNRYAQLGYDWKSGWSITVEHSIFSEEFKYQYVRLEGQYEKSVSEKLIFSAMPYAGITYCNNFYNWGVHIHATCRLLTWLILEGSFNPHYDSDYKYGTCYMGGIKTGICRDMALILKYSTIPEYRIKEKRFKLGLEFNVRNLMVSPVVSLPVDKSMRNFRMLFGMKYYFGANKI